MSNGKTPYCLDSNAFIEPWTRRYPIDLFPDYWESLEEMGDSGIVLATEEVLKELEKIDDGLKVWAKARPVIFRALDEPTQENVLTVLAEYPRLIDSKKNRSMADPFVVAQAMTSESIVVTEEIAAPGSKSPKIPDVCNHFGIECVDVLTFMRNEGMIFHRR